MAQNDQSEEQPVAAEEQLDVEQSEGITQAQIEEIKAGKFVTVKELAEQIKYSPAWLSELVHKGRIKGVKPTGGAWRIPESEAARVKKEGALPLPRAAIPEKPGEIVVEAEHRDRVTAEPEERKEEPGEKKVNDKDPGWPLNLFLRNK